MNIFAKRGMSVMLALVLIVSLFSGVVVPASAASYTYNWGTRGVTATSLSSAAVNFYSGTSYEELSSYTGSSSLNSVPSSALYRQLQSLMAGKQHTQTSYKGTRDLYKYTDCQNGGGRISSFYSGVEIGPDWDSGATWNREHTWPNSKGDASGNGENDIMMLRPTAKSENGGRGNKAYGISGDYYDPNMESGYTLNLHGDVARIMLYVYVRWGNTGSMWGSSGVMESREVLLAWMEEDPVDTWELGRNDVTQEITGTRNVFVDYPELAFLMFGEEIPDTMPTPSGMAIAGAHDIQVSSNDTAMGTVSISGKNIQAYPAVGHKVVGYEVVSGTAEVTQNGNAFEVKASSDCEIKIIFAPKLFVEMTYRNNGQILSSSQVYDGDPVTLAAYTETAPANFTFLGWVDAPVSATETVPTYYKVGASYTVSGTTNMHALFSWVLRDDEGSRTCYTTSTCAHGDTVNVAGKDATCTSNGYTAGVYCNDCESYISGHAIIGSQGHAYTSVVTPPTVTDAGYTTHTCGRCGDIYISDPVPALGEDYTVSFCVPSSVEAIEDMTCNSTGILLPEADDVEGGTFLGWVTSSVEDTTEEPEYLKAGDRYVATASITLYALYTYTEGSSDAPSYVLADSIDDLKVGGKVIIAAAESNVAMSTEQKPNNRGQAAITKNGNSITFDTTAGVAVFTLCDGAVAGTYAFFCPTIGGFLYTASSSGNQLKTQTGLDASGSFQITIDANGVATVKAQGGNTRNWMRHNSDNSLFACYASGQKDISLYVEGPSGTVHYTTEIGHVHEGTYHAPVAATCQKTGTVEYWSCDCGLNFADSECTQQLGNLQLPLDSNNHEEAELRNAVEATCESEGYSGDSYCSGCGEKLKDGTVLPKKHNVQEVPAKAATFEAEGNIAHFICGTCNRFFEDAECTTELKAEDVVLAKLIAVATVGGERYETLAAAIAQAKTDETVQLLANTSEGEVILADDVDLDLNGYTVTAEYVFAPKGCEILDSSETNSGVLKADEQQILISPENAQLPVWNGEGFVFTTVSFRKALISNDSDSFRFVFLPLFRSTATELLKDGATGNKVTFEILVSWETPTGQDSRRLQYNDEHIKGAITSGGAFTLACTGLDRIDLVDDLTVEGMVVSTTDVSAASGAIVVKSVEEDVTAPEDPLQIVKDAYALAGGEELPYNPVTLTGTIDQVNSPWSDQYGNITVTIYIDEDTNKEYPIECYRMVSSGEEMNEAIKMLAVGDTITVAGQLMKYQNATTGDTKVEFNIPELIAFTDNTTEEPEEVLDTPEKIVNAAYALAAGESLTGTYSLTGKVLSVDTPYSPDHDNITVTIQIGDMTDKPIQCYRMKGEGAAELKRGDIITVTGSLKNYNKTIEFDAGCTFVMVEKAPEVPEDTETETVTITFDTTDKRTVFSTEQQVWEENGITVTNDKASSSSDVANYVSPARFYKSSKLTVEYTGMTKLEFACSSASHATALKSSINVAGATVTASGSVVTVELSAAADSFVIASLTGGQVRVNSITVTVG